MKKDTKYKYVRKTMTWEGRRYEVTGKTEAEAMEKLGALKETLRRGEGKPAEGFLRTLSLADSGSAPIVPASRAGTLW